MRSGLFRSTPFRLILWIGTALIVGLVIAGGVAFALIREELLARTDRGLTNTWNIIAQSYIESDAQDLEDLVSSHVSASAATGEVFQLIGPGGSVVQGNIGDARFADGWDTVPPEALGLPDGGYHFRIFAGDIGDYRLLVGMSMAGVDDIGGIVVTALTWVVGGLVVLVAVLGGAAAINGQRRLDTIADTMERVARGDLKARIPLTGRRDDIDGLVASVNAALDRLAALVDGMRQVSVDIAHELKTPLNRLTIAIAGAQEAADAQRDASPLLEEAQQEIGQVISIFDAMLRIAQIEGGARKARFDEVSLAPILENLFEAYAPVAADKGQVLQHATNDQLGEVWGDRDLLTQAVANLIENAIRYCPDGARISLAGTVEGPFRSIIVSDSGPGIPDDEKPKVFDRLYRVEKSRTTPGNGLGLSLVKAIVELHGASISLSDNHPGLKVRIQFPQRSLHEHRH